MHMCASMSERAHPLGESTVGLTASPVAAQLCCKWRAITDLIIKTDMPAWHQLRYVPCQGVTSSAELRPCHRLLDFSRALGARLPCIVPQKLSTLAVKCRGSLDGHNVSIDRARLLLQQFALPTCLARTIS
jgi:hypothetical protein